MLRSNKCVEWSNVTLNIHVFQLDEEGGSEEVTSGKIMCHLRMNRFPFVDDPFPYILSIQYVYISFIHNLLQICIFSINSMMTILLLGDGDSGSIPSCTQWLLPSKDFFGLWETLIYDTKVKQTLLDYTQTAMLFSDKCVDKNVIAWNRWLYISR
jgi:hypothetical protein